MNPARLFRPLDFNDQLFKDRFLSTPDGLNESLFLDSQPQPLLRNGVLQQRPVTATVQVVVIKPSWESNQKAANSDFGAIVASPFLISKKAG